MPLGEILIELLVRTCIEFVFYGLTYWTGFLFLKVVTFGSIRIAPLMSIDDRNPGRRKWYESDWSLWIYQPTKGKRLKAGITCCVGFFVWVSIGIGIYFIIVPGNS